MTLPEYKGLFARIKECVTFAFTVLICLPFVLFIIFATLILGKEEDRFERKNKNKREKLIKACLLVMVVKHITEFLGKLIAN